MSTYFSPRWIPKEDEKIFFNSWNDIYDEIRKQKLENEIIVKLPSDIELYRFNVIKKTRLEHKALSSIRV